MYKLEYTIANISSLLHHPIEDEFWNIIVRPSLLQQSMHANSKSEYGLASKHLTRTYASLCRLDGTRI